VEKVRIGVIGIGNMGSAHSRQIDGGLVAGAELAAVCDQRPDRQQWARENLSEGVRVFGDAEEMMQAGILDAIVVATPHYDHPPLAIKGFQNGLHVLIEKPAGVYTRQVRQMNEAAAASGRVFAIMFNQRTSPVFRKLKDLIDGGELGEIRRIDWIKTNWFRSQFYYNSGGWRATWAGEGGGVLLNQCPHNLDLWQWLFGLPERVRATCYFGKYHEIEVEDEVFALMEYANGAVGTFKTGTGEAPGTDRLEVCGDRGKLVLEGGRLTFWRTRRPVSQFTQESRQLFGTPEAWECAVPIGKGSAMQAHCQVLTQFVRCIREGGELVAPGEDGIRSLELSNAMLLSSWTGDAWVSLPVDEDLYYEKLQQRAAQSTKKTVTETTAEDISESFHK